MTRKYARHVYLLLHACNRCLSNLYTEIFNNEENEKNNSRPNPLIPQTRKFSKRGKMSYEAQIFSGLKKNLFMQLKPKKNLVFAQTYQIIQDSWGRGAVCPSLRGGSDALSRLGGPKSILSSRRPVFSSGCSDTLSSGGPGFGMTPCYSPQCPSRWPGHHSTRPQGYVVPFQLGLCILCILCHLVSMNRSPRRLPTRL